jgi:hypothetical protein
VSDIAKLRRWLLDHAGRGSTERLLCFIPDERRATVLRHRLLALTGASAAAEYGLPVLTVVPRTTFRVDTSEGQLDDVPESLGGFRTDQGANTVLIADPSRLAFLDLHHREGFQLAPPSRVLLDLRLEPRGDAAAELFLDLWGAKELT